LVKLFYKYFITYNILVSLLTGFLLKYDLRVFGITPSVLFSAAFIIFSAIVITLDIFKRKLHILLILAIFYFHFIMFFNVIRWGSGNIIEEINYTWNLLLPLIIILYASKYLNRNDLKTALKVNNIIIVANIIIAWIFDIGFPSYVINNSTIGYKGFLYGGNTASVLVIATFVYYLIKEKDIFAYVMLILAFIAALLVQTIATLLVPMILLLYLVKNYFRYAVVLVSISAVVLTPKITDLFDSLDIYRLNRITSGSNQGIINGYLESSRRIVDSKEQLKFQLNNPDLLFIGAGRTGQKKFWQRDDFNFAGMDLSDILFRYGIIGFTIYYLIFIHPILNYKNKIFKPEYFFPPLLIILYSLFGGYVSTSITTLVYLSIYISIINKKVNHYLLLIEK